jgi:hypothetical protein
MSTARPAKRNGPRLPSSTDDTPRTDETRHQERARDKFSGEESADRRASRKHPPTAPDGNEELPTPGQPAHGE